MRTIQELGAELGLEAGAVDGAEAHRAGARATGEVQPRSYRFEAHEALAMFRRSLDDDEDFREAFVDAFREAFHEALCER